MEETISLKDLVTKLKKKSRWILFITMLSVFTSGIISYFFITPVYQASTQILVNESNSGPNNYNNNQIQANLQLIDTYNVIIKSPAILNIVNDELDSGLSASELNEKITVRNEQDSQVVTISVQDADPQMAANFANKTAEVFHEEIVNIMNVDNVKILSEASITAQQSPIKPRPVLNMAVAFIVGLLASIGFVFLLDYFDNTVKTEEDLTQALGLPVLGSVSQFDSLKKKGTAHRRGGRFEK